MVMLLTTLMFASLVFTISMASSGGCPENCRCTSGSATIRCITPKTLSNLRISTVSNIEVDCLWRSNISDLPPLTGTVQRVSISHCSLQTVSEEFLTRERRLFFLNLKFNHLKQDTVLFRNDGSQENKVDYPLRDLDLSYNHITSVPAGISKFGNLDGLWLNHNKISSISQGSISELKNLKFITIKGNKLKEVTNDVFKSMHHLNTVDLSDNEIANISLSAFHDVPQIRRLDLSNNLIPKLVTGQLKQLSSLSHLNMSYNRISDIEYNFMENCSSLQSLDLSGNLLTQLSDGIFQTCSSLTYLTLRDNKLHSISSMAFQGLTSLFVLNLNNNKLQTLGSCFHPLSALNTVYIKDNTLREIKKENFVRNLNLDRVDLSNNSISRLRNGSFSGISYINLDQNNIHTLEMNTFRNTEELHLILTSNPVTELNPSAFISTDIDVIRFSGASFSSYPKELCPRLTLQATHHAIVLPFTLLLNCTKVRNLYLTNTPIMGHEDSTWDEFWGLVKLEVSELPNRIPWKLLELTIQNAEMIDIPADYTYFPIHGIHLLDLTNSTVKNVNFLDYLDVRTLILDRINLRNSPVLLGSDPVDVSDLVSINYCNLNHIPLIFKKVEEMNLRGNSITSLQPVTNYLKLRKLDLSENKITYIPSGLFDNLLAIQEINLSNNMISNIEAALLPSPTHMQLRLVDAVFIDISNNRLKTIEREIWTPVLFARVPAYVNFTGNPLQCHCGMSWFSDFILERQLRHNSSFPIPDGTCLSPEPMPFQKTISKDYHCSVKINSVFQTNLPHEVISVTCVAEGHPSPEVRLNSPTGQNLIYQKSAPESKVTFGTYTAPRTYLSRHNITHVECLASVEMNMTVNEVLTLDLSMDTSPMVNNTIVPKLQNDSFIDVSTEASTTSVKSYTTIDIIGAVVGTFLCTILLAAIIIGIFVYSTRKKHEKFFHYLYHRNSNPRSPPSIVLTMSETLANGGNTMRTDHEYDSIENMGLPPTQHANLTYESEKKPSRFIKIKPPVGDKPNGISIQQEAATNVRAENRISEHQYQDIDDKEIPDGASNVNKQEASNVNKVQPNGYNNVAFTKSEEDYVPPEDVRGDSDYQNEVDDHYQSMDEDENPYESAEGTNDGKEENTKNHEYQDMGSDSEYVKPDNNSANSNESDSDYVKPDNNSDKNNGAHYQNSSDNKDDTPEVHMVSAVSDPYEDMDASDHIPKEHKSVC